MARNEHHPGFSLKDHLFNEMTVSYLATLLHEAEPTFKSVAFKRQVLAQLPALELKDRIRFIATTLSEYLSPDYPTAVAHILKALPPPLDPSKTDNDFGSFIFAPLGEYIVRNGLREQYLRLSLTALRELTMRFSMEDAIRPFINTFPDKTLAELSQWTKDGNYHVRRLVSEGTRPMLPWSGRLTIDPQRVVPFLETLYADPTRYVTRSVANHLNDLSKTNPELVLELCTKWQKEKKQTPAELAWLTKHALRTLLKRGDQAALGQLGYTAKPPVKVTDFKLSAKTIKVGERLGFTFEIAAKADVKLLINYKIDFVKSNGSHAAKVYRVKVLQLIAGESASLCKQHRFVKNSTTLTFYAGVHHVTLQINGQDIVSLPFTLVM